MSIRATARRHTILSQGSGNHESEPPRMAGVDFGRAGLCWQHGQSRGADDGRQFVRLFRRAKENHEATGIWIADWSVLQNDAVGRIVERRREQERIGQSTQVSTRELYQR